MPIHHLVLNEIGMSATLDGQAATAHVELGWPPRIGTASPEQSPRSAQYPPGGGPGQARADGAVMRDS